MEKIILGVCESTGNAYAKKFRGTQEDLDAYLLENSDLTPIPAHLEGQDLTGLAFIDGEFVVDNARAIDRRNEIARNRRRGEYPPISDQLDALMKWAFSETEIGLPAELKSLAGQCMAVKSKHPIEGE